MVRFLPIASAIEELSTLRKKPTRQTPAFKGVLEIGEGLAIPVVSWRKVVKATMPKMEQVSKAAASVTHKHFPSSQRRSK